MSKRFELLVRSKLYLEWVLTSPRCLCCGRALEYLSNLHICGACIGALERCDGERCARCYARLSVASADDLSSGADVPELCVDCVAERPAFERVLAPWGYDGALVELLSRIKYGKDLYVLEQLCRLATPRCAELIASASSLAGGALVLIPAPMHPRALLARGFSQTEILCEHLSRVSGSCVLAPELLRKNAHTRQQAGLSRIERVANLAGVFQASPAVHGRHVLLVDDVMTTGATARACSLALRQAGAASVQVLVVARR